MGDPAAVGGDRRHCLNATADAFFETTVWLVPLERVATVSCCVSGPATGTAEQADALHRLANILPDMIQASTSRHLLAIARAVLLTPNGEPVLAEVRRREQVRAAISPTAARVLATLEVFGHSVLATSAS